MNEFLSILGRRGQRRRVVGSGPVRRGLVFGLAAAAATFAVAVLALAWGLESPGSGWIGGRPYEPTVQVVDEMIQDVGNLTGWSVVGIKRPTVQMVEPSVLQADEPGKVRFGQYTQRDNTIRINELCRSHAVREKCQAILFHELIHWVQRASVSWPGTPTEWELEAQMWERRWLARQRDVVEAPQPRPAAAAAAPGHIEWTPAGEKPSREFLATRLRALLPKEAQAVWSEHALDLALDGSSERHEMLKDGCFMQTDGQRLCTWVLKLLTRVGTETYGTVITLHGEHPLSVDLRRFNPTTERPEVLGWWWDLGYLPDAQGRLSATAAWTGKWVQTRGPDHLGSTRAAREGE